MDHAAGFSALATSRKTLLRGPLDFLGSLHIGHGIYNGVELLEGDAGLQEGIGPRQRSGFLLGYFRRWRPP